MTVGDLIEKLGQFDSALTVVVDGYEGGYDNPASIAVRDLSDVQGTDTDKQSWWTGRYDDDEWSEGPRLQAVVISR